MSGEVKSQANNKSDAKKRFDSQMEDFIKALDEKRKTLGVPDFTPDDVDGLLSMSRLEIASLGDKERACYSFSLAKLAYLYQKQVSRYNATLNWIDSLINQLTAEHASKYCDVKFTKFPEQRETVLVNNDLGKALARRYREIKARLDDIHDLNRGLDYMARILKDIKNEKRQTF